MIFGMIYSSPPCLGRVRELSLNGFCLEYLAETRQEGQGNQVDLVLMGGCGLKRLPCRQVSDQVVRPSGPPFFGPEVRCRRLVFDQLSPQQQTALGELMRGVNDWPQAAEAKPPLEGQPASVAQGLFSA